MPSQILNRRFNINFGRIMPFANTATRREAKAILFQELAAATRNGMPLDEALNAAMRTEENVSGKPRIFSGMGMTVGAVVLTFLWVIAISLFIYLALGFLTLWFKAGFLWIALLVFCGVVFLLGLRNAFSCVERVARTLAMRLHPYISAGHSLSEAMTKTSPDYTKQEIAMIRAGESWNNVPSALDKLGAYQFHERECQRHWQNMAYPVGLLFVVMGLLQFMVVFITPKYKDIYDQLGMDLPASTQFAIAIGKYSTTLLFAIGYLGVWTFFALFILRLFMTGNRLVKSAVAFIIFLVVLGLSLPGSVFILGSMGIVVEDSLMWLVFVVSAILSIFIARALLLNLERLVLWGERVIGDIFGSIPIIGAPRRTERESRWLAALATGLDSGIDTTTALEAAGSICGGMIEQRSQHAANLVTKGHSIGSAVLKAGVLRPEYGNRLRLLDNRADYLAGLAEMADDAARESYNLMNRASRVAEVASVCMIGATVGFFAFATYMPLFNIPLAVGK